MNVYIATEQAYKNGYEAGVKEFAEKLEVIYEELKTIDRECDAALDELKRLIQRKEDGNGKATM